MKVKFVPQNVEHEIKQGQSVMDLAHEKGIDIRSTCNGLPSCAECRIKIVDGEWNVNPPSRKELSLIGTGFYIDQRRLSCQMLCFGDITVDTQEQVEKAGEGPVTKKFLTKVHKATAAESHSLGGVLIEQDSALLQEAKKDMGNQPLREERPQQFESRQQQGRQARDGGGRDGQRNQQHGNRNQGRPQQGGGQQQARGDSGPPREGGRQATDGGGRKRRRRRGGRGGGSGGGNRDGGGGQQSGGGQPRH
jgi:ferredoxin